MSYWEERLKIDNKTVYRYWKEQCGLVSGSYARKVLGVSREKFKQLSEEYGLTIVEKPAPAVQWKTKLYSLPELYELKEELKGDKE